MLSLIGIVKNYYIAGQVFPALKGADLQFRNNEFVSILGPSGCGKTTMLNIIGGLDRYTSGDLLVDGKSTKNFKEHEWDAYRNATIGFVFQTYNLISHLSVLDNVEMSLRLSGVPAQERRQRALKVLDEVGLTVHVNKRPNQLSGGQMQRVAIARALINNPKVLLADEPTGALDSQTSVQIMELIQKISKNRLVIMVTHNRDLAEQYSDRIVELLDGKVVSDTRPQMVEDAKSNEKLMTKRTTMPFSTALKTSYKNLLTKKGRTFITAFAGSIGIIGIALVLSISEGMNTYVASVQSDALAGFPISIPATVREFGPPDIATENEDDYPDVDEFTGYDTLFNDHSNNFTDKFVTYLNGMDSSYYNSISYSYALSMRVAALTEAGAAKLVSTGGGGVLGALNRNFYELPNNQTFILNQYDLIAGNYPTEKHQAVLVVDQRNRVGNELFNAYGINPRGLEGSFSFEELLNDSLFRFKVLHNNLFYVEGEIPSGNEQRTVFSPNNNILNMYNDDELALAMDITGVLRIKPTASGNLLSNGIGYLPSLTNWVFDQAAASDIVETQNEYRFVSEDQPGYSVLSGNTFVSDKAYQDTMKTIGGVKTPVSAQIYPASFESKDLIKDYINDYNLEFNVDEEGSIISNQEIKYTDLAATITGTITNLINTISVVLTAFASISLFVSSIMIGIITYVSVIERTKEIGIMRSLGARKKDISRIFNAETIIIGFASGLLGIGITLGLNIPIDFIILELLDVPNFTNLTPLNILILVVLSTALTLLAGLIPSGIAAKKDPVIALRTE